MSWLSSYFSFTRKSDSDSSDESSSCEGYTSEPDRKGCRGTPSECRRTPTVKVTRRATVCSSSKSPIGGCAKKTPVKTPLRGTSSNTPSTCKTPSCKTAPKTPLSSSCKVPTRESSKTTPKLCKTPTTNSCKKPPAVTKAPAILEPCKRTPSVCKTPAREKLQPCTPCKTPGREKLQPCTPCKTPGPECLKKTPSSSVRKNSTDSSKKPSGNSLKTPPASNIIHKRLELTDPNPDPVELFEQFNNDFFQGKLQNVNVKWSSRMTQCAGICHYKGKREGCEIVLSVPLLAFRARKDLVETLLHEMIHAYLFIADGNREREEHGPKFLHHMERINKRTGCNITVEHDYICEVDYYQAHVWQCTGPCRNNSEDKGIIRRSVNRAPGPSDSWWEEHMKTCKGKFVKISEPAWKPSSLL